VYFNLKSPDHWPEHGGGYCIVIRIFSITFKAKNKKADRPFVFVVLTHPNANIFVFMGGLGQQLF
jgi:hypothetical protein